MEKPNLDQLIRAIEIESHKEKEDFSFHLNQQSPKERAMSGKTLYPLDFKNHSYAGDRGEILIFQLAPNQNIPRNQLSGKVRVFSNKHTSELNGWITRIKDQHLEILIAPDSFPDWIKDGQIGVDLLPDSKTWDIQINALKGLQNDKPDLFHFFYSDESKAEPSRETPPQNLNTSQKNAFEYGTGEDSICVIHGPPGTGKTTTLISIIKRRVERGEKVLICTPTNAAADHITSKLEAFGQKTLRIGNPFKIADDCIPYSLDYRLKIHPDMKVVNSMQIQAEKIKKKAFKFVRNFDKEAFQERKKQKVELRALEKEMRSLRKDCALNLLRESPVVCGTFVTAYEVHWDPDHFDALVIDEAGQALEPLIWSVAKLAPKMILAGDPFQLPPFVSSNKSIDLGLSNTLLEKWIKGKRPSHLLTTQYRMNDQIMGFSNQWFYENKLIAAQKNKNWKLETDPNKAIEFIDTAGTGYAEQNEEFGSIRNPGEVEVLVKRIHEIKEKEISLGIITPYRGQLEEVAKNRQLNALDSSTVDSFQGQEKDLIIISLVRSNTSSEIGFLKDYRRMNVALTRAKKKLILIGDSSTLAKDPFYEELIVYIEKNGSYRSAWEFADIT